MATEASTSTGEVINGGFAVVAFPKPPTPPPAHSMSPTHEHQRELAEELRTPSPPTLADPPPPYPTHSHGRRSRAGTARSARRLAQASSCSGEVVTIDTEALSPTEDGSESTPLLSASSRRRPRTISHSTMMSNHSLTQTVLSLFRADPEHDGEIEFVEEPTAGTSSATSRTQAAKRYFRALWKSQYYWPLLHLLVINFPYALLAFVYLFVGTLTGTTLLIALPLGAVICWFNLIGARAFARGEIALQTSFHGPLAIQPPNPPNPIFSRRHPSLTDDLSTGVLESGQADRQTRPSKEPSFLRNTYAMFTDQTSYQALFYFLVIKPSITLFLTIALFVAVPVSFVLIIPAPAMLRAVKRIGVWQANIALEGLCRPRL